MRFDFSMQALDNDMGVHIEMRVQLCDRIDKPLDMNLFHQQVHAQIPHYDCNLCADVRHQVSLERHKQVQYIPLNSSLDTLDNLTGMLAQTPIIRMRTVLVNRMQSMLSDLVLDQGLGIEFYFGVDGGVGFGVDLCRDLGDEDVEVGSEDTGGEDLIFAWMSEQRSSLSFASPLTIIFVFDSRIASRIALT